MSTIKRHYRYSGSRRLHYRRSGTGPPLVMLHAAPGSSFGLRPAISRFADRHSAIALDLPGYGESEPLTVVEPSIADYADWLAEALDALGLERVDLWGAHTGAKVSLEFAVRHPHRVRRLALAGIAAYTGKERRAHIENYTPSPTPESDGSHLIRAWTMRRDMQMFWPWYLNTPEARIHAPLPSADQLHDTMVDFLRAIPDYWKGYQAAFRYDSVAPLSAIPIPVLVAAAPGDPLAAHLDRFGELPANVKVERPETSDGLVELVEDFLAGDALPAAPPPPLDPPQDGVVVRGYVNTMDGQLVIRKTGAGSGRPLVMFHAAPGSSAPMEPLMLRLGADRPVFAFDTPGNGDSDPLAVEPTIGDFSQALGTTIDTLGLDEFDVYGAHTGALIAIETAISRPTQVPHLIFDGVTLFTPEETQDYLTNYPVPLVFSQDGSYLIWSWNFRRDMGLWWPWYNHSMNGLMPGGGIAPAEVQHAGFVEFLKGGRTYHLSYRAAFAYPIRERLPLVTNSVLHCSSSRDPLRAALPEAMELSPKAQSRVHQGSFTAESAASTLDLYRRFLADQPLPDGPTE